MARLALLGRIAPLGAALTLAACSADGGAAGSNLGGASGSGAGGNGAGAGSAGVAGFGGSAASTGSGGSGGSLVIPDSGGSGGSGAAACSDVLTAVIRDFNVSHPDFETYGGVLEGIVKPDLGADDTPDYAPAGPTTVTTGPAEFAQWYHDVPGVNIPLSTTLTFTPQPDGSKLYDNSAFFPIDNQGWGNGPKKLFQPATHNYLFTTEIHISFTYKAGQVFTFRGDDDLWVFINKKLAIDLGGVHGALEKTADIDALAGQLGISLGQTYAMDIFGAERHTVESNFRIQTTIDCFKPPVH